MLFEGPWGSPGEVLGVFLKMKTAILHGRYCKNRLLGVLGASVGRLWSVMEARRSRSGFNFLIHF